MVLFLEPIMVRFNDDVMIMSLSSSPNTPCNDSPFRYGICVM